MTFDDYDPVDKVTLESRHHVIGGVRCHVMRSLTNEQMGRVQQTMRERDFRGRRSRGNERDHPPVERSGGSAGLQDFKFRDYGHYPSRPEFQGIFDPFCLFPTPNLGRASDFGYQFYPPMVPQNYPMPLYGPPMGYAFPPGPPSYNMAYPQMCQPAEYPPTNPPPYEPQYPLGYGQIQGDSDDPAKKRD